MPQLESYLAPLESIDRAYMARALVQATLPHSDPGPVPLWSRKNGDFRLSITPSWEIDKLTGKPHCVGVPYGTIPRLLLFWITTEAVKTKSRRLTLGPSLSQFMHQLGLTPTGGRWGSITRLREQMRRLFRARISFDYIGSGASHIDAWMDMQVAPTACLWWSPQAPEQAGLWQSWIELDERFFNAITAVPVPLNMLALKALKQSPLALDLYAWATYKTYAVSQKGNKQFVSWYSLAEQLGTEYKDIKNFKRKAKGAFDKIRLVYPGLRLTFVPKGLDIHPGLPAVPAVEK